MGVAVLVKRKFFSFVLVASAVVGVSASSVNADPDSNGSTTSHNYALRTQGLAEQVARTGHLSVEAGGSGEGLELELTEFEMFAPGQKRVITRDAAGTIVSDVPFTGRFFEGRATNVPGSHAGLLIASEGLYGVVEATGRKWSLQPVAPAGENSVEPPTGVTSQQVTAASSGPSPVPILINGVVSVVPGSGGHLPLSESGTDARIAVPGAERPADSIHHADTRSFEQSASATFGDSHAARSALAGAAIESPPGAQALSGFVPSNPAAPSPPSGVGDLGPAFCQAAVCKGEDPWGTGPLVRWVRDQVTNPIQCQAEGGCIPDVGPLPGLGPLPIGGGPPGDGGTGQSCPRVPPVTPMSMTLVCQDAVEGVVEKLGDCGDCGVPDPGPLPDPWPLVDYGLGWANWAISQVLPGGGSGGPPDAYCPRPPPLTEESMRLVCSDSVGDAAKNLEGPGRGGLPTGGDALDAISEAVEQAPLASPAACASLMDLYVKPYAEADYASYASDWSNRIAASFAYGRDMWEKETCITTWLYPIENAGTNFAQTNKDVGLRVFKEWVPRFQGPNAYFLFSASDPGPGKGGIALPNHLDAAGSDSHDLDATAAVAAKDWYCCTDTYDPDEVDHLSQAVNHELTHLAGEDDHPNNRKSACDYNLMANGPPYWCTYHWRAVSTQAKIAAYASPILQ